MKEENINERSHFVISTNALYGIVLSMFLGGAGTYGTVTGQFQEGDAGQCPNYSSMALSLAERNGQELADIRDVLSNSRSVYRREDVAKAAEERQRARDEQQDRRTDLVEREFDIHVRSNDAHIQQDK